MKGVLRHLLVSLSAREAVDAHGIYAWLPDVVPRAQRAGHIVLHEAARPENVPRVLVTRIECDRPFGEPGRVAISTLGETDPGQLAQRSGRGWTLRAHALGEFARGVARLNMTMTGVGSSVMMLFDQLIECGLDGFIACLHA